MNLLLVFRVCAAIFMAGSLMAAGLTVTPRDLRVPLTHARFVILSLVSWLYVLRHVPLSLAFPLSNVVHVLVPLASWLFLGELISTRRWWGITLVLIGLIIVAKPVARIEEKL